MALNKDDKTIIIDLISETCGETVDSINEDTLFHEDLGFDSMDNIELIMELESQFCISIPDEMAENTRTVKQAMDLVDSILKKE